jgi:hypothetical protein
VKCEDEIMSSASCLNNAFSQEWIFVLLARDEAAPVATEAWIAERIRLGKNKPSDPQIVEAQDLVLAMRLQRPAIRHALDEHKATQEKHGI